MGTRIQIGYKAISEATSRLASFLTVILAARLLAPADFGVFSLAWALGWIVAAAADFGLQLYLAREVSRSPARSGLLFRRLLRLRCGWTAALLAAATVLCSLSGWPAQGRTAFLILIGWQLSSALIEFLNYFYRGLEKAHLESTLNLLHRLPGLILAGAILLSRPSLTAVSLALLATSLLTLAVSLPLAFKLASERSFSELSQGPAGIPWKEVFPIGIGIILSALYFRLDLFLIEWWEGTSPVASYNAAHRLMEGFRLLPAAVLAVVFPLLCRDRSGRALLRTSLGLFLLALPLSAAALWASSGLLGFVYDGLYAESLTAFRILLAALPLLFANAALTHQLTAWNLQRLYAWLALGGLLCNALLNAVLIPRCSIAGAAWATLLTEVYLSAACILVLVRERSRGQPRKGDLAQSR
ncbi:MAG: oligosaccharide flippase family protein [Acidobacteriota bacterium]